MSVWNAYRDDIVLTFQKNQAMAEKAYSQLDDDRFFQKPGEFSNSVAIIVKHVAGNLRSRFTDFLTTDGEKPTRDRDREFVITADDTRGTLLADWDLGWRTLYQSLEALTEADWLRTVTIRNEPHTVLQAIHRSIAHTAYHSGQIVYLSRLLTTGEWKWITIPPGQSQQWNQSTKGYLPDTRPPRS